jgi:hypothetical protein
MAGAFDTRPGVSWVPTGYQKISDPAAATGLTPPDVGGKTHAAIIRTETQAVRWRDDADPTATDGIPMLAADPPLVFIGRLSTLKFIRLAAGAIVHVMYYRVE